MAGLSKGQWQGRSLEGFTRPSLLEFIRMEDDLINRLGVKVDLVMKKALKPHIGRRILEEVVPV